MSNRNSARTSMMSYKIIAPGRGTRGILISGRFPVSFAMGGPRFLHDVMNR